MTQATQNFFDMIIDEVKSNTLTDMSRFNISVNLYNLVKKVATDRQWAVKNLPHNSAMLELFSVFINQELKPKLQQLDALQALEASQATPALVTTHHRTLREALELFIMQQLEELKTFEFNIEKDGILPLRKILFYLEHTLNFDTNHEQLKQLLITIQDRFAQDLFFTATYLLMNTKQTIITTRIQYDWLASQFLQEEKAPVIDYIIGHWTRKVLIHSLISQSLKMPEKEPETDEEKLMVKEIIFTTKAEEKNK